MNRCLAFTKKQRQIKTEATQKFAKVIEANKRTAVRAVAENSGLPHWKEFLWPY
ncbi:hypothetical protein [Sporomusa acidovorans]|uniref:hypothetical protein n=1 Tax=Sporomusa acidovorans TaxID=112900 RepID=UPI00146C314E|nr:hypothetical protein [Sporomusa acidovorans]